MPRVAAIPLEDDRGDAATYYATTHSALQSVPAALENLKGILTGTAIDLGRFRSDVPGEGIGLSIQDVYSSDQAVRIDASPPDYAQTLSGTIERLDQTGETRDVLLRHVGGVNRVELPLPPGLYRVSVQGRTLQPVEDVFLVLDPAAT